MEPILLLAVGNKEELALRIGEKCLPQLAQAPAVEQTNVEALIEATRYDMSTRYEEHERLLQQAEQIARELKEPTCTILRLCYFEHLTYQQAADRLGISPNTVKKHISKALAILRERMKHTNIEN